MHHRNIVITRSPSRDCHHEESFSSTRDLLFARDGRFSYVPSNASTIASCRRGLTWRISCAERSGQVRLVSSVTESCFSGSIHNDVPVKPRCPKDASEKYLPDDDTGREGLSQPSARVVPGVESRRVNSFTVSGLKIGVPARTMHSAKRAMFVAGAKTPACPATPPITYAFSSLTSP